MNKVKKTAKQDKIDHEVYPESDPIRRELQNQLKRALADYQNLERRVEEERKLLSSLSSAILIEKFLPVLDNLENAQNHLNDEGLGLVVKQFQDVLKSEGVEEIPAEGAEFDPNLHEATEVTEGPDEGRIVKVVAKGYKINDRVIRPAKVVVSKKIEATDVQNQPDDKVSENIGGGTVDSL